MSAWIKIWRSDQEGPDEVRFDPHMDLTREGAMWTAEREYHTDPLAIKVRVEFGEGEHVEVSDPTLIVVD